LYEYLEKKNLLEIFQNDKEIRAFLSQEIKESDVSGILLIVKRLTLSIVKKFIKKLS